MSGERPVFAEQLECNRALASRKCRQLYHAAPLLTVHRTVNKVRQAIIVSGVPPHVVPPERVSRKSCPRSFMGKGRVERPFPIEDALAMRPLRPTPAGVGLPLAELIFGKGISLSAESDQGAALDLQAFEKA